MLRTCLLLYSGIITTGSALPDYQFYVSAYRVHYSSDGQDWTAYQEAGLNQDKVYKSAHTRPCVVFYLFIFSFYMKCDFPDFVFRH